MPRPTPAQLAYGSSTVVSAALALLLVSGATSGLAIALIAVLALALGVLVALYSPLTHAARHRRAGHVAVPSATPTRHPGTAARSDGVRATASAQRNASEDGTSAARRLMPAGPAN